MAGAGITHLVHGETRRLPQIAVTMALLASSPTRDGVARRAASHASSGVTRRWVAWAWMWLGWTGLALFLGVSSSLAYIAVGNPPRWSLTIRMALAETYVLGARRAPRGLPRAPLSLHARDARRSACRFTSLRRLSSASLKIIVDQVAPAGAVRLSHLPAHHQPGAELSLLLGHRRGGARLRLLPLEQGA